MINNCDRSAWIHGGECNCPNRLEPRKKAFRFVLLGAPGVGKGTLAALLSEKLKICQLATGDIFRNLKQLPEEELTPALKTSLEHMLRGELVPDDIVIEVVRDRMKCLNCPAGFVLDGFPRTLKQAEALDEMLAELNIELDAVINLEMPIDKIIERLGARRICKICGAVYNLVNRRPKIDGKCDHCGGELYQREDDKPESIRVRMDIYNKLTTPLIEYYSKKGKLLTIDATIEVYGVYNEIKRRLDSDGYMPPL